MSEKSRDGVGRPRVGRSWGKKKMMTSHDIDGYETNGLSYESDWAYASNSTSRHFTGQPKTNLKSSSLLEHGCDEGGECNEDVKEGLS